MSVSRAAGLPGSWAAANGLGPSGVPVIPLDAEEPPSAWLGGSWGNPETSVPQEVRQKVPQKILRRRDGTLFWMHYFAPSRVHFWVHYP